MLQYFNLKSKLLRSVDALAGMGWPPARERRRRRYWPMSDGEAKTLYPLVTAQLAAVEPGSDIWLGASAGTGKTQVLTARVIRLLLMPGVRPENLAAVKAWAMAE